MSKMRIYELAKELGVDNRVVLTRAQELGMPGKNSHSNSLDADEADQIRRSILRQAIGPAKDSEVVTTRVDKLSGATEAIVERRKGNVIRRRKAGEDVVAAAEAAQAVEAEQQAVSPELQAAEDLFFKPAVEPDAAPTEQVEEILGADEPTPVESVPMTSSQEPAVAAKAESAPVTSAVAEVAKKTIGPKILGRIELPQKKTPKIEKTWTAAAPVRAAEPEEEDDWQKKAKKKTKRREISRIDLIDYDGRGGGRRGPRTRRGDEKGDGKAAQTELTTPRASKRVVKMEEAITVGELARQMSLKSGEIIAKLIQLGIMATINQMIDQDTATLVAEEFGFTLESTEFKESEIFEAEPAEDPADMALRPPVVTVMGHVDHGKTSLLDSIRSASVAAREAGGITQHIGAYSVTLGDGRKITFIDTPGHAAFTSMRARGAQVTDIVILVVAADDGVMPQTIEAVNHAKAAGVPIVVAVNKIDKHEAQPDRVKQQLTEHGLQPEDWGGDTMYYHVSALKKTGISQLLEGVLLQAEMKELRANPRRRARGTIIEARQDRGRGTVATILVQSGTLRLGDIFVSGPESGRVRSMLDFNGEAVEEAGPSMPVEITGLSGVPSAGDDLMVVESEADAREIAANRAAKKLAKEQRALATGPISLEEFAKRAQNAAAAELNVILKADVHGSVEAVETSLNKLSTDKVKVRVLHAAVGGVNESDIQLAIASKAIVIGFGVRGEPRALQDAENIGVQVRFYRIIYELIDDVKQAMAGLLAPIKQESHLGRVEVRETFMVPKIGAIAGSYVVEGVVKRGANVRLLRDSRVIHEGKMSSLRRFKDDVREVQAGYECGIGIENYNDVKVGDVVEVYEIKEIAATLE